MRKVVGIGLAVGLLFFAAVPVHSQTQQLLQGTLIRLVLLNGLSSSVAREGDPFAAAVAEPVLLGDQLILPAGTRVRGEVGAIIRPKRFSIFRGQAAMNLYIRSIEFDHREVPAPMSILAIAEASASGPGKVRKDLRTEEGAVVQARRDIKGDLKVVGLGGAGGTVAGAVFSHIVRGLTIGLIGSTAYAVARKGKEVELPAHTALVVRLDNSVSVPTPASGSPRVSGQP